MRGCESCGAPTEASSGNLEIDAQEIRDVGDDRVLLLGSLRLRGAASGIESRSAFASASTALAGKLVYGCDYISHEDALKPSGWRSSRYRR